MGVGVGIASAQTGSGQAGQPSGEVLENLYQRALLHAQSMQLRIDLANKIASRVDELIAKANGEGKDTTALAAALATFKTAISASQASLDTAKATLSTHAGFDANGNVTDADQARATLKSVREAMREAAHTLRQGTREFRHAFRQWRQANKPTPQPSQQP